MPTAYAKEHNDMTLEHYKLGERRMKTLGIEVSKLRERLRDHALSLDKSEARDHGKDIHEVSRLAQRIRRGDYRDGVVQRELLRPDFVDNVPSGRRKRSRKRGVLTTADKIDITHRVIIEFEKQTEVAKEYRVTSQVVASIIHKAKKNKNFLKELLDAADMKERQRHTIQETVSSLNHSRSIIDSAKDIVSKVNACAEAPVSEQMVRSVMKEELGMCYRKIKTVSLHSNSEKNLVLRQRWAIEFLDQARKKKIFLNIDETWLGMSDFRRMKW